jgi:predicted ArsR family transcriptional regulator
MLAGGTMTAAQVAAALGVEERRVHDSLDKLKQEGFLRRRQQAFTLAN